MFRFKNAQQAFEHFYGYINNFGEIKEKTKYIQNVGFYINNPTDRYINTNFRRWNVNYAQREWEWYLSGNKSVEDIKKHAKIWDSMHSGDNIVNSNYGYQWQRNDQIGYVISELIKNKNSRRAYITILDSKEHEKHEYDTPCTLSIGFNITNNELNMNVMMRSNDLWYGFCNDQYCFSMLQETIAVRLGIEVGWYYHFVNDLHIYNEKLNK